MYAKFSLMCLFRTWVLLFLLFPQSLLLAATDAYRLGAGDVISILVYGEEDLSMEARISDRGSISYPFIGELQVAGKTLSGIEQAIHTGLLGDYLVEPKVTVTIKQYRNFYMSGEVKKAGAYPYQPGLTVGKAIAMAGGFTDRAARSKIYIRRDNHGEVAREPAEQDSTVMPGDVVMVEESFF